LEFELWKTEHKFRMIARIGNAWSIDAAETMAGDLVMACIQAAVGGRRFSTSASGAVSSAEGYDQQRHNYDQCKRFRNDESAGFAHSIFSQKVRYAA